MDNIENENVIQEQIEQPNEEITFNYSHAPMLKPLFELGKRDTTFALCALAASVFSAVFGIFGGFAFGYLLSTAFMIILFSVYFIHNKKVGILPIIFFIRYCQFRCVYMHYQWQCAFFCRCCKLFAVACFL